MDLLTQKQKQWLVRKTINVGEAYMFPRFGFTIYSEPKYSTGEYIDINPFTKSLDAEAFLVKEKINGFCKGNFERKPKYPDMYLTEEELSRRDLIEITLLFLITALPMILWNLICAVGKNLKFLFTNLSDETRTKAN